LNGIQKNKLTINLCTYFDKNYLSKFLVCKDSIIKNEENSKFYCLCLDQYSYEYLSGLSDDKIILISIKEIEDYFLELKEAKINREKIEYYFTLSPFLPLYIIKKFKVDIINYIDSDLFFFDSPRKLIKLLEQNSIMIIEHGIKEKKFGKFNVGWLTFRNDQNSLKCLNDWGRDCVNWCYDYVEGDKYADQKYLDKWPTNYKNVLILSYKYCVAPWNLNNHNIKIINNTIYVNNKRLIFFHFHGLWIFKYFFSTGFSKYNKKLSKIYINFLYKEYIDKLLKFEKIIKFSGTNIRNEKKNNNIKNKIIIFIKNLKKILKILIFFDFYKL